MVLPLSSRDRLILFTRYPQPGKTKTRLIPALGAEAAASLHRQMAEYALTQVQDLMATQSISVEIWFANGESEATGRHLMQAWLGSNWVYQPQGEGDLGERMARALRVAFAGGMEKAVIMGTDCPGLDAHRLSQAFQTLNGHDLVLGTATDGGYYLIGLRRLVPELFIGIDWGSDRVFQQTLTIAEGLGLKTAVLPPLTDIDRPEDLPIWEAICLSNPARTLARSQPTPKFSPRLSIIIPVLNEANTIQAVLSVIQQATVRQDPVRQDPVRQGQIEVIVVDGGSQDQTIALAQQSNTFAEPSQVRVISAPLGRASQMNAGAAIATGEILLFLHADTRLPRGFETLVEQTLVTGRSPEPFS